MSRSPPGMLNTLLSSELGRVVASMAGAAGAADGCCAIAGWDIGIAPTSNAAKTPDTGNRRRVETNIGGAKRQAVGSSVTMAEGAATWDMLSFLGFSIRQVAAIPISACRGAIAGGAQQKYKRHPPRDMLYNGLQEILLACHVW